MLQKQPLAINFTKGLDTKADPFQVQVGNFLALQNSVFTTTGRLTKRNGYNNITQVAISGTPAMNVTTLTTFNGNLIATGKDLFAYSQDTDQWVDQGSVQPIQLDTMPLIRSSTPQINSDAAVASNGLVCFTYLDSSIYYYQISDSVTGQQIVARQAITNATASVGKTKVFVLGSYFIVLYLNNGSTQLEYIAIPISNPSQPRPAVVAFTGVQSNGQFDGAVLNQNNSSTLYIAFGVSGIALKVGYITSGLVISAPVSLTTAAVAGVLSVSIDTVNQVVWIAFSGGGNIYAAAVSYSLVQILAPTSLSAVGGVASNITSNAINGNLNIFTEIAHNYGYTVGGLTGVSNFIVKISCNIAGTPSALTTMLRSVGLASKAFTASNGVTYMAVVYGDAAQVPTVAQSIESTYFLIDSNGQVYMKLAFANAGGYLAGKVLPSITSVGNEFYFSYLKTDFLTSTNSTINTSTSPSSLAQSNAIYTQTGVQLAKINFINQQHSSEIASTLNLTGGILWEYDGVKPVENGFHIFPEYIAATTAASGGSITAQQYFYSFTYEWTNNQGNIERSAPSVPITITTTGSISTNTIKVPTLRITYKTAPNPVRIVGYRWSAGQQVFYQFTSITSPTVNDPTVDNVTFTDTSADSAILGNPILYTTGGVIENIGAPASRASALFDNRLWLIDAEDQNLLWFSKQVIENVPVEMSDLLTYYVAPTTSAQGSTGNLTAIYPMDDKLILFKKDAIYYVNGTGPDNTGSNSGYSQPIFITSSIGTANPNSIVLIPAGLMFQSDKGIWLLGRDLITTYIGAPVEAYNSSTVMSASNIPGTTQARFILSNNLTLMYDYFFDQWATHTNVQAISGTLYNGLHAYLASSGRIYQETPGVYTDGGSPVLLSLTTSWINVAGLQGFERFYFANLLGTYLTPFKLQVGFAFNYNPSPSAYTLVVPDNYTTPYGDEAYWGSGASWGSDANSTGAANVFSARLFPTIQKCQSFQVQIQEVFDPSFRTSPGEGLTLSGLALIVGVKRGWRTQSAGKSFG